MQYLYGENDRLLPWLTDRIAGLQPAEDAQTIGIARDGAIAAAVVFDDFTRTGCAIAIATDGSKRWLTRQYLFRVFAYPFIQCHLQRIGSLVSVHNLSALRLNRRVGMVEEGVLRCAGPNGENMVAFGMLRHECRFLPPD